MAKKKTGISEELREAINEAARAGAYEAYKDTAGAYVNYFKAMETLLYNYKKLAALVADEEWNITQGERPSRRGAKARDFMSREPKPILSRKCGKKKGGSIGKRSTASSGWRGL